ncbi:MAG: winged helix-turn-helix domain-containing protein [Deltaproteobacteria bacterium]|jgi:transposase|nr:winged helix-turn-helix domain-containing protein [Deltaproteobacteria bacterium]
MKTQINLREHPELIPGCKKQAEICFKRNLAPKATALLLSIALPTIYWWKRLFEENDGIIPPNTKRGRKTGSGRLMTMAQEIMIQFVICNFFPRELDIYYNTWTLKAIRQLILESCDGLHIGKSTIKDYLKRWGYSSKKPTKRSLKRNVEEIMNFFFVEFPRIVEECDKGYGIIMVQDESAAQSDSNRDRGYSEVGGKTEKCTSGSRFKVNFIIAHTLDGETFSNIYTDNFCSSKFLEFL